MRSNEDGKIFFLYYEEILFNKMDFFKYIYIRVEENTIEHDFL